jgi:nicotinate-nucleotide pyrophosphorylase (carboxylating)
LNIDALIKNALKEDIGAGDITTRLLVPADRRVEAQIIVREPAVICGLDLVRRTFLAADRELRVDVLVDDSARVKAGQAVVCLRGRARGILTAERLALNWLGRLSGVSTLTRLFVDAVRGTRAVILDTRKTTPGFRSLERYAVCMGGAQNHRFDLGSMVLVKDNHRALSAGHCSLADMVKKLRGQTRRLIEVEVDTLAELDDVLREPPDMVLLDNMTPAELRKAVKRAALLPKARRPLLEASGGITLGNVAAAARAGVDRVSVGALTHSARCIDVSMEIQRVING